MRRKKIRLKYKKERVLLSDVLPYELPFIFTNRYFYRFLVINGVEIKGNKLYWSQSIDEGAKLILASMFNKKTGEMKDPGINVNLRSIPFRYSILHKPTQYRQLSIVHPANQIKMVEFYDRYKNLILYLCSKSRFSIRHPEKVACYFFYRDRLHHVLLGRKNDKLEMYFSEYENLKTFFTYKRYANIYKFYEDYRYQRAEKKFRHLLKFDLQSCFDNIYTHSMSWAICGGKDIFKEHYSGTDESFGGEWDKMMQELNYSETNGIVIGPEFSRIFAEVILQYTDQRVEAELNKKGYKVNVDYECYRYVDDYFLFFNSEAVMEAAIEQFSIALKEFKLNISSEKTTHYDRPFVTKLTKAKIAIDGLLDEMLQMYEHDSKTVEPELDDEKDIQEDVGEEEIISSKVSRQKVINCLSDGIFFKFHSNDFCKRFKSIISDNDVEPKDILNYTLARMGVRIERILKKFDKVYKPLCIAINDRDSFTDIISEIEKRVRKMERIISDFLYEVVDSTFFLYAMNKRVNTTLKAIQILNTIIVYLDNAYHPGKKGDKAVKRFTDYIRESVFKKIRDEVSVVLQTAPMDENVQLETMYFFVLLRQLNKKYQLNETEITKYLKITYEDDGVTIKFFPRLNAISVIILLYYFGSRKEFERLKEALISDAVQKIKNTPETIRRKSAECIILALDMVACPFIETKTKLEILNLFGRNEAEGLIIVKYLARQKFMFTKWTNVNVTKELNAKISQEVYS